MATTEKERVHLFAADPKHGPFYAAIVAGERKLGHEVQVSWLKGKPQRNGFWNKGVRGLLWEVARRPEPVQRIYLEEYLGLGHLLFTWLFCLWHRQIKISLCIHNLNKWFFLEFCPRPKRIATYIAGSLLLRRVQEVIVLSDELKRYGENICRFRKTFRVIQFSLPAVTLPPGATPSIAPPDSASSAIAKDAEAPSACKRVTIPGNVDERRRDYVTVFEACRRLAEEGANFKLVLLGKLKRESMSERLRSLVDAFAGDFPDRLVTFDAFIEDRDYAACIAASTCLIANLIPYFEGDDGTIEIYGLSKETGIRSWADAYDKPCLTPHEMPPGANPQNYQRYRTFGGALPTARQSLAKT